MNESKTQEYHIRLAKSLFEITGEYYSSFFLIKRDIVSLEDCTEIFKEIFGESKWLNIKEKYIEFNSECNNQTNFANTFLGAQAGRDFTWGAANTFVGSFCGSRFSSGVGNLFLGTSAGGAMHSGDYNILIGDETGPAGASSQDLSGSHNIYIGHQAGRTLKAGDEYRFVIETEINTQSQMLYGEFDNDKLGVNWDLTKPLPSTLSVNGTLHISETAKLEPQAMQPTGCNAQSMGTLYADAGGVLYFCDGTAWKTVQLN